MTANAPKIEAKVPPARPSKPSIIPPDQQATVTKISPQVAAIVKLLKHKEFKVIGTRGWNEAEFTAGGIPAEEVDPLTLESKLQKGLYFAGEVLDVQGRRGGYHLAWAWASGAVAGKTA